MSRSVQASIVRILSSGLLGVHLVSGCVTTAELPPIPQSGRDPARLLIVDCLLPPQLIGFGVHVRLGAPRPIKASATDCAIRGGSYVLYDRADYRTALEVWLAAARDGDAEAQTYVGEIYEKGMGTTPDYAAARHWYERAAGQGLARAQINLGYLYEAGLGVVRDMPTALGLYRKASDLVDGNLEYVSTIQYAQRAAARSRQQRTAEALEQTRTALEKARARLSDQQRDVERYESETARLRARAASLRQELLQRPTAPDGDASRDESLVLELERRESRDESLVLELERRENELEQIKAQRKALTDRLAAEALDALQLRERLEALVDSRQDTDAERAALSSRIASLDDDLSEAERQRRQLLEQLAEKDGVIETLTREHDRELDVYRRRLSEIVARSEADRQQLTDDLLQRERELAQGDRALREIQGELAERERELGDVTLPPPVIAADDVGELPMPELAISLLDLDLSDTRGGWIVALPRADHRQIRGRVTPPENIAALAINGEARAWKPTGEFDHDRADDRTMDVAAEGTAGQSIARKLSFITVPRPGDEQPEGPFVAPDTTPIVEGIDFGAYRALIIGNRQYRRHAELPSAGNDARRVQSVLEQHYGFDTQLLVDATHAQMLSRLVGFTSALVETDNAVIFYAGHCRREEDGTAAYWLPVDAGDDAPDKRVSVASISAIVESSKARHVLVIADTCFSNTLTPASIPRSKAARRDGNLPDFYRYMLADKARVVLSSGGTSPLTENTRQSVQSIFTRALVDVLTRNRAVLEASELYRNLLDPLARAAGRLQRSVDPQYSPIRHAGHAARDFLFVPTALKRRAAIRSRSVTDT